jgi:hypothetical protein
VLIAKLAFRGIRRHRAIAVAVVLTAGVMLAGFSAVFALADQVVFRGLPYPDAERIVHIAVPLQVLQQDPVQSARLHERLLTTALFDRRAGVRRGGFFDEASEATIDWQLRPAAVTPAFFDLFGARPLVGRTLTESDRGRDDSQSAEPRVAVISESVWRNRFGADLGILDRPVKIPGTVGGRPWRIVGVLPSTFAVRPETNLWTLDDSTVTGLGPNYARLARGVSIDHVRGLFPGWQITPLREHVRPAEASWIATILASSAAMILAAWIQLAMMTTAYVVTRRREVGIQLALGASRTRIAAAFALQAGVLGLFSVGVGAALVPPMVRTISAYLPEALMAGLAIRPDARTFVFAGACVVAGLALLAVVPLQILWRVRPSAPLTRIREFVIGRRIVSGRTMVLIAELAVTTAVVYAAGIAVAQYHRALRRDLGFEPDPVVAFSVPESETREASAAPNGPSDTAMAMDTLQALRRLPGVAAASFADFYPFDRPRETRRLLLGADPMRVLSVVRYGVAPGFVDVLGARIAAGQEPTALAMARDSAAQPIIVNQVLADQIGDHPLGASLTGPYGRPVYRVTGVIDDIVEGSIDEPIRAAMYVFRPPDQYDFVLLARLQAPVPTDAELLHEFTARWGERAPRRVTHVRDVARGATDPHRARVALLGAIAVLMVPIMLCGVAGTILHTVRQDTRAIALSLALGGDATRLRIRMVWRIAAAALCAVGGGLMLGLMAARIAASSGGPVAPDRIFVAVSVAVVVSTVATTVAWIATRSMRHIDVFQVLRDS